VSRNSVVGCRTTGEHTVTHRRRKNGRIRCKGLECLKKEKEKDAGRSAKKALRVLRDAPWRSAKCNTTGCKGGRVDHLKIKF